MIMRKVTSDDPYIAESGQGRARKTGRSGPDHDKRRIDRCASKREGQGRESRNRNRRVEADGGGVCIIRLDQGTDTSIHAQHSPDPT